MAYKLPKKYKWKARRNIDEVWSYFTTREKAVEFAGTDDLSEMLIKPVRMGT